MTQPINAKCRTCWWREGRSCFNEALGPVPKTLRTFKDSAGIEQSYNTNIGHEITEAHLSACQEKNGVKTRAAVWGHVADFLGAKVVR